MPTKKTSRKKPAKKAPRQPSPLPRKRGQERAADKVSVRIYRQGFGDCMLLTAPGKNGTPFYLLIDCGLLFGVSDAQAKMREVVEDIRVTTGGRLDVLAVTHEHWDHVSGFSQAIDAFRRFQIGEIWLAWTEDPADPLARRLAAEQLDLRMALTKAEVRLRMAGSPDTANEIRGLLEFFGAGGSDTSAALRAAKSLSPNIRYFLPGELVNMPAETGLRAYVLGPPHEVTALKKLNGSVSRNEVYGLDSMDFFMESTANALEADPEAPFDYLFPVPIEAAQQMPFFQQHYWGEDRDGTELDQSWRRIDASWLGSAPTLALQLDNLTNNTSLVLAFEVIADARVLLFAADAQIGNWLSWDSLHWKVGANDVTAADLLERTVLYKAGHHGSHNASLREKGIERMRNLQVAMVPVSQAQAVKRGWKRIPLTSLMDALGQTAKSGVLRTDQPAPAGMILRETDLYFELDF